MFKDNEKIINFKYRFSNGYNKMRERVLQLFAKIKFLLKRLNENAQAMIIKVLRFIVNIDISFLFVFAMTYLFDYEYPWQYRLIGSYGIYTVYKMLYKHLRELIRK